MSNPMTPDDRSALLFQVQRALDGAEIGRSNLKCDWIIDLSEEHYLFNNKSEGTVDVWEHRSPEEDPFEMEPIATFTEGELFPPLVWISELNWDFADTDLICFEAEMLPPGELYLSNWDDKKRFTLKCHTGALAKDAAQCLADIMAKADRARRAS